tara:strand:- start:11397 stop:11636 length:240 start_codon:yes stop_codon:yes gene_type:complete
MPNGLNIPDMPEKVSDYRSKMWFEMHWIRHEVELLKKDRKRLDALEDNVKQAKTWAKASAYFVGAFASLVGVLKKTGVL